MRAFAQLAVLALVVCLSACGGTGEREASEPEADRGTPADSVVVRVWNILDEEPVAVERRVAERGVEAALGALVQGPTAEERQAGHTSWFADSTAGVIRDVTREDGLVVVDFHGELPRLMSGAGTSFGSLMLMAMLDSTVFQFPAVDSVEYRLDGSCAAFGEWVQTGCEGVQRSRVRPASR